MTKDFIGGLMLLRQRQVTAITGLPRSTIYLMVRNGDFPAPIKLSTRTSAWLAAEVEKWLKARLVSRDTVSMTAIDGGRDE